MEPDISDQYDSIGEYIAHRLMLLEGRDIEEQIAAAQKRQVNVRIPQHAYEKLLEVAEDVGETPSGLTADLLELAIYEAAGVQLIPNAKEEETQ